jgi:hypothetical protein
MIRPAASKRFITLSDRSHHDDWGGRSGLGEKPLSHLTPLPPHFPSCEPRLLRKLQSAAPIEVDRYPAKL